MSSKALKIFTALTMMLGVVFGSMERSFAQDLQEQEIFETDLDIRSNTCTIYGVYVSGACFIITEC